ncbi:hypothetical protein TRAPUB_3736 [Trametes pubescens]|uniref:DUF6534 domain-containing protein n=1 Tax=Trametes pubescens TaxID=154538 RepID=A0A1M2VD26_TRAPU|nr:hypothetical protein TRAPUB_3736 [Trametes pubescens]
MQTWLGGSALADIVIAVTMTILLLKTKTGFRRSDSLVNKLARLAIESGTVTASVAIVDVVMFSALPQTLYHECPALALSKLYANMMLASLNNRAFIRRETTVGSVHHTTSGFAPTLTTLAARSGHSTQRSAADSDTVVHVDIRSNMRSEGSDVSMDYAMRDFNSQYELKHFELV